VDAVRLLRQRGFEARRLTGGLPDWSAEGRPIAAGTVDRITNNNEIGIVT